MSAERPDVVLYCHHRVTEAQHLELYECAPGPACDHCEIVQRFRWLTAQNVWSGTRRSTDSVTLVHPDQQWEKWDALKCGTCGNHLRARDEKLQPLLTLWSTRGMTALSMITLRSGLTSIGRILGAL